MGNGGVSHNDESLRKHRNSKKKTSNHPQKCNENGSSSIKRAQKQQNLEFWTREEPKFCASENEQKRKNDLKEKETVQKPEKKRTLESKMSKQEERKDAEKECSGGVSADWRKQRRRYQKTALNQKTQSQSENWKEKIRQRMEQKVRKTNTSLYTTINLQQILP